MSKYCAVCGKENTDNCKFCVDCGAPMKGDAETPSGQKPVKMQARTNVQRQRKKGINLIAIALLVVVVLVGLVSMLFRDHWEINATFRKLDQCENELNFDGVADIYLTGYDSLKDGGISDADMREYRAGIVTKSKVKKIKKIDREEAKEYMQEDYSGKISESFAEMDMQCAYIVTVKRKVVDEVTEEESEYTSDCLLAKYNGKWYIVLSYIPET